ncbi:hypothetical protein M406DRAFT_289256 [Cryphonectria parasitica EP155]|uniref:Uncharacterized protein n=1 Tax=Cryphonectria parasitica (strain ATCC 38755 / EP155) TaxID=660469 RepID=A0A9P5CSB3_CRYP1|nr:uncharacterized protein M406DRAFT_289256 [Cryphonectria parasitica EP155]KAF3767975.1 hypothetical protein M406DRAFT_289256 [Cryphonectria parasitica EP155]
MATASRSLTPGGALLRASRMFSLPSAIPSPPGDYQAATSYNSDTATAAYPTLQTVTAPESFRQRGDWGFKRNFPLRSTAKTSTPYLRVKQVDSLEHVTDFTSAADHTLSLEKWQEMNIAVSLPHNAKAEGVSLLTKMDDALESVFEDKHDFTAIDDAEKINEAGHKRWKFKGPWLANLTEGEFQTYLKREVRGRRAEFRQFLRQQIAPDLTKKAKQRAMDEGLDREIPDVRPEEVTDEQVLDFLREVREYRQVLYDLVGKFLDLAPLEPPYAADHLGALAPGQTKQISRPNPYARDGPPATHPSAGLSYLRSNAYLENHPVYGPQQKHKPVKARIMHLGTGQNASVGVGGFVSASPLARTAFMNKNERLDFKQAGGSKLWVNIVSAQVNSDGRAVVNIEEAERQSKMVQEEMQGERQLYHQAVENPVEEAMQLRVPRSSKSLRGKATWKSSSSSTYGLDWADEPRKSK